MTQPAVHGQHPDDAPQTARQATGSRRAARRYAGGRPAHGGGAEPLSWRKAAVIAAAGVPVGLLWWLLAPSGLNLLSGNPELRSGGNTEGWLPRDLVLAGLFLLAGCIAGAVASGTQAPRAVRPGRPPGRGRRRSWAPSSPGGPGVLCGLWWGTPEDTSASASIAFSLRSFAVLAIWPAATALAIFLNTVFTTPKPEADGEPTAKQQATRTPPSDRSGSGVTGATSRARDSAVRHVK